MFKACISLYCILNPKLTQTCFALCNRPGTLWTIAVLNWWQVLVGKEPAAFTVNPVKSGAAQMEGMEVMEEAL